MFKIKASFAMPSRSWTSARSLRDGWPFYRRCSRLTVYVRAGQSFTQHPQVANSASDLLLTLFGQDKLPARSALGVHTLPMGIPVEIDSIFELKR